MQHAIHLVVMEIFVKHEKEDLWKHLLPVKQRGAVSEKSKVNVALTKREGR
jgi:hypothetical protein